MNTAGLHDHRGDEGYRVELDLRCSPSTALLTRARLIHCLRVHLGTNVHQPIRCHVMSAGIGLSRP
jgi:hypothetical protein